MINYSESNKIVRIRIDRAEKRNALDSAVIGGLLDALGRADQSESARVIILEAAGPVFSAGADLAALERMMDADFDSNLADSTHLGSLFSAMQSHTLPIVGRIHGHAIAGGSGLVVACDHAIAIETAKFGFTEVKLGFVPALVLAISRTKLPEAVIRDIMLSGRLFQAAEARQMGLVADVVANQTDLDDAVEAYASHIVTQTSKTSIAKTKQMILEFRGLSYSECLERAARHNAESRETEDCRAGVRAFLQKKPMPWSQ